MNKENVTETIFAQSLPINTFLFRLMVSDLKCNYITTKAGVSGCVNISICSRPDIYASYQFDKALKATANKFDNLEKYFGVKYPLTKYGWKLK